MTIGPQLKVFDDMNDSRACGFKALMNLKPNLETLFTYPCATLHNYQNTLMHKSEPKANPTLITHSNKVYELKVGTTRTHRNTSSFKIQF